MQFNYHITLDFMHYSCPYVLIGKEVDVRVTDSTVEIFFGQERVASHKRLYGWKGRYSTVSDHMPEKHQQYQEWNGDRFRQWARKIGTTTYRVTETILASKLVEEQTFLTCRSLLKLADTYTDAMLEEACCKACQFSQKPSYNSVKIILQAMKMKDAKTEGESERDNKGRTKNRFGITRGADYYGGGADHAKAEVNTNNGKSLMSYTTRKSDGYMTIESFVLLLYAAEGDGKIIVSKTLSGTSFFAGGKYSMNGSQEPREIAKWDSAVSALLKNNYIKQDILTDTNETFSVTQEGYNISDGFKESNEIDVRKSPEEILKDFDTVSQQEVIIDPAAEEIQTLINYSPYQ